MSNRISTKDIDCTVYELNIRHGYTPEPYTNGKANTGTYYIDNAYGGVKLVQVASDTGGIREVSPFGYGTKRELYTFLRGMLA